uniref:Response regulatory domain-containing protein n=1 Tax=Magnetococcus massalia (strain MO-1) TaxID=451514 RepID=A0A1S7LNG9_MAGMO|nr:Conserved protein of unknown function. Containing response regulator receiver domain [Candidatus Magnetococcus massalia]
MDLTESRQATILAVDDVPGNLKTLTSCLGSEYNLLLAKSGESCLELVANQEVDLILLDIVMPEMDGYEVLRRLKAEEASAEIPVIFLTGRMDVQDEAKGLMLGADDYILKPPNCTLLNARVKTQLICYKNKLIIEQKVQERTQQLKQELLTAKQRVAELEALSR